MNNVENNTLEVTKKQLNDIFKIYPDIEIEDEIVDWIAIECDNDEIVGYLVADNSLDIDNILFARKPLLGKVKFITNIEN